MTDQRDTDIGDLLPNVPPEGPRIPTMRPPFPSDDIPTRPENPLPMTDESPDTTPPPPKGGAPVAPPYRKQFRAKTNPVPVPDFPIAAEPPSWVAELLRAHRDNHDATMSQINELVRTQNVSLLKIESELANFTLLTKAFSGFQSEVRQTHYNIHLEQDSQRTRVSGLGSIVERLQMELDIVRRDIAALQNNCPEGRRLTVLEKMIQEHLGDHPGPEGT